jgi:hypothetical protein
MKTLKTICVKIQLQFDKLEKTMEWANELNTRKEEVYETLRAEGIYLEYVFIDMKNEKEGELIYFIKVEDIAKNKEAIDNSTFTIDIYHKAYKKEAWGEAKELKQLLGFERLEEYFTKNKKSAA